ncbi:MAG: hypothetical protein F4X51_10365 [Gemmatimonadetes bacterium]|nr:hypothetical protein [Gemmatimonadota bacterium]
MTSKLAELRKEAGLTQVALAQSLSTALGHSITQAQVSKHEASGEIPIRMLRVWAETIGCTTDDLLPPLPVKEETIFDFDDGLYGSLTEDLNLLLQYIDRFSHRKELRVKQFRDRVTALKEKPWVVLTGHFDAGKSHLCNFYLRGNHLPTGYRPVTRYPTFVRHISNRPQWLNEDLWLMGPKFDPEKWNDKQHCTKNRILAGSWDTLEQHATLKGKKDIREEGAVLAFVDAPLLHSCVLIDLPGYDDIMTNASIIDRLGRRAAILMYLCRAQGFLDGGDFARLGYLLRALPQYKEIDDNFPILGNLFIIVSHAHHGITKKQLENQILEGGSEDFYEHFKANLLAKLSSTEQPILLEDIRNRFFSFYQEIPTRRKKLEQALKILLGKQIPSVKERSVTQEIFEFKNQETAFYAEEIGKYEKILKNKKEAKKHYEKLEGEEPKRKKKHDREVERIEQKITAFKEDDLKNLRAIFKKETKIKELEALIEKRYTDRKKAQKHASAYVLEEIQSQTERFRGQLVDKTSNLIESFVKDYNKQIGKLESGGIGEFSTPFDTKGAFLGGLAGLSTLGALGAWAATLGNLGGYIIVAKGVSALSALGISFAGVGGTAGVTALVSALGGPITLALGVAVAVGAFFSRLFGDSWQRRLAKKIKELFEEKKVLSIIEDNIKSFWDSTLTAFKKGADSLDKQHKNHIEELKDAFGGSQDDLKVLEKRLERYEEIKSFFAAIPWR